MAAQGILTDIAMVIDDEDDVPSYFHTIVDPVRLKRIRTVGKKTHTKADKTLMQAIRVGDDPNTVRALRAKYVSRFDGLETRQDRYVNSISDNSASDDLDGEAQWI
jgi:hypothetical protein